MCRSNEEERKDRNRERRDIMADDYPDLLLKSWNLRMMFTKRETR